MEVIALLTLCTSFVVFYGLIRIYIGGRVNVSQRVAVMAGETKSGSARRISRRPKSPRSGTTWMTRLDTVLKRAEIDLQAREFVMRWGLVTLCLCVALYLLSGWVSVFFTVCCSGIGTLFYLRMRAGRRSHRFNEGLSDMLTIITNSLRAGHSFVQAIHLVSQDMQGPIQEELVRIEAEMQLGVGLDEALQRANERVGSADFDLIVTSISIQRQIGGNLAEVLERISDTIRERVRLKREVKALTSQGRLSASIFMVLPAGVGVMLYMINPFYMRTLFQSPLGIGMLAVAVVGQIIGYLFIRRIVNVEL